MTSYLITGGSGALGTALAKRLLALAKEEIHTPVYVNTPLQDQPMSEFYRGKIVILSRGEFRQHQMAQELTPLDPYNRLRFFIGDVRDRDRLKRAMQGIDVVIHAAALKRIEVGHYNPIEMVKTNVLGAVNVIEAAQDAGVGKVVGVSSDKAFQPVSPYGHSKAMMECLFLAANGTTGADGPRFAVCRYGNVWGSTGSVVPMWQAEIAKYYPNPSWVNVTDVNCTRFFMRMEQAVDLVLDTARTMKGEELAIPKLPAYRLEDLAEALGTRMRVVGLPKWEKLHESMDENNCSVDARRMTVEELKEELCQK